MFHFHPSKPVISPFQIPTANNYASTDRAICMAFYAFTSQDFLAHWLKNIVKSHTGTKRTSKMVLEIGHYDFQDVQSLFHSSMQQKPIYVSKFLRASSCTAPIGDSCKIAQLTCQSPTSLLDTNNPNQFMELRQ